MPAFSRRVLLSGCASLPAAAARRPRVTCILNVWFPNSHADVFLTRLLEGYRLDGSWHAPRLRAVSFYVDQFPPDDRAREQARRHGISICPTVAEALRAGVDTVAVIGEHGHYPRTPLGNFAYPRRRYFDETVRAMREDRRTLPLYLDKYFASSWADAKSIYDRVLLMRIPVVCGSVVPRTWRRPPLEIARGAPLAEVLATSYSDIEEHAYHAIELLQAMAERRRGGETGVARVRYCRGEEVWQAAARGEWSRPLLDAALSRRVNSVPPPSGRDLPEALLIRYRDGLRGAVLHLNALTRDYLFAARLPSRAEPLSTCAYLQLDRHDHWGLMVRDFEDLVLTGRVSAPIERTLYANGIMLAGLESRRQGGTWIDTPELSQPYS